MILTDRENRIALAERTIEIDPVPDLTVSISSSSIDLTLSDVFRTWPDRPGIVIDPGQENYLYSQIASMQEQHPRAPFTLRSKSFVLAWTRERVRIPFTSRLAARVEGKSSLARLGVSIHVTAPIIHSGFEGQLQLEMYNFGPFGIVLTPGMRICQLVFEQTTGTPERGYAGMFRGQSGS